MTSERRRVPRRAPEASEPVARLRLRTGRELVVVNIGSGGALVECESRLLPGTHVDVHVIAVEGRVLVRSRVLRAFVSSLAADRIVYRGAIAFEQRVDVGGGYAIPGALPDVLPVRGTGYPVEAA